MRKFWRRIPEYSIGIDFGTTISRIAYLRNEHRYEREPNPQPPEYFPIRSLVSVHKEKDRYIWNQGDDVAKEGTDIFRGFKLFIQYGKEINSGYSGGISIRPELLAARIIYTLHNTAAKKLGKSFSDITRATLTVPAQWNIIARKATIKAAEIAGRSIGEINLIEEPVAAFLATLRYRQTGPSDLGENVLVFDCGGGTLDVAVIKRRLKGVPIVVGRAMDDKEIAGEHIDNLLVQKISAREGVDWDNLAYESQRDFLEAVRDLKHNLNPTDLTQAPSGRATYQRLPTFTSRTDRDSQVIEKLIFSTSKALTLKDKNNKIIREYEDDKLLLTFRELDECLQPLEFKVEKCILNALQEALKTADVKRQDISSVIMTGGSSYLRHFQGFVKSLFSRIDQNVIVYAPDSAIAQGAALYQQYIDTDNSFYTPTLALDTYMKYEDAESEGLQKLELGSVSDCVKLPYKALPWPSISVPTNKDKIEWQIFQKRSSSTNEEEVDIISFERSKGMERLYLEYQIDANGLLKNLRPRLFQGKKPVNVSGSKYDWNNAKPSDLAVTYNIFDE